jgi:hypothetical protein
MKAYDSLAEFKRVTVNVLKKHCLAEYIAVQPNIRDCVRLASTCQTEEYVVRARQIAGGAKVSFQKMLIIAVARPIPLFPPVITAIFPSSRFVTNSF